MHMLLPFLGLRGLICDNHSSENTAISSEPSNILQAQCSLNLLTVNFSPKRTQIAEIQFWFKQRDKSMITNSVQLFRTHKADTWVPHVISHQLMRFQHRGVGQFQAQCQCLVSMWAVKSLHLSSSRFSLKPQKATQNKQAQLESWERGQLTALWATINQWWREVRE